MSSQKLFQTQDQGKKASSFGFINDHTAAQV